MDDAGYGADRRGFLDKRVHRFARGYIDDSYVHIESGITDDFCSRIKIFLAQVSQQNVIARADSSRDFLTN